jgi:hypothetical protein
MKRSRLRLAVAVALFVGWLGWLVYLAATGTDDVVLSRPQFLVADVHLVADVKGGKTPDAEVTVETVYWAAPDKETPAKGKKITLENLPECGADQGWAGPGRYILALAASRAGTKTVYRVAAIPRSPGYPYGRSMPANRPGPPRIYLSTPSRVRQLEQIEKAYNQQSGGS